VLIVHSFGSSAPPFTTHSTAFESALKKEMGAAVDLDEVSLDMARYAQPEMEEAFVEFLGKRLSKWQPDLVIPVGSPAGRFVAKFRDRLFPRTPVIYTGMDRRTLPDDAFANNATFVGESFDLKGLVDDMLQLDPQTNHVVVILGATPLERYWTKAFAEAFAPFAGRIKFTWVNDLTFEQMRDLVSKLPPHSFVLLGLLLRDASGVTYNQDDALGRLNAVSRAPINGMFQHQVGLGVVGGRLYQGELEGIESARVAVRVLRGEPASAFPPQIIGTREPMYDWRELRRWGFDERRLPPGSVVLFRQPTPWERYRWQIVGAVAVIAAQAGLIVALLLQRRRRRAAEAARRSAEADAQRKRAELAHVARVASLGELTATLAHELSQPLTAIQGNSDAARRFLAAPAPDLAEVRDALTDISADTHRAGEIIQRLRGMLKPGGGAGAFKPVDLNEVIRTVERLVRGDGIRHRVTVDLDLDPDLPPTAGDPVQLQQVVMNLMLNAFAAMDQPELRRRRSLVVRTRALAGGSRVGAEFEDAGVGIGAHVLERLFEPFVTTKANGLGMGLAICRSILDHHGGDLRAANNPAGGATFSLTLPARPRDQSDAPATEAATPTAA
jgi:signal transduction histidine kinase